MDGPVIKRVLVWSGWLRTSHASIGLAVLVLLFTGWLIAESPSLAESALELHYLASGFLIFGLVVRIVLMFSGMEHERLPGLVDGQRFGVNIIPYTLSHTTWGDRQPGDLVNLEIDLLALHRLARALVQQLDHPLDQPVLDHQWSNGHHFP